MVPAQRFEIPERDRVLREPRVLRICKVAIEHEGRELQAVVVNISKNGAFIRTETPLAPEQVARLEITLAENRVARLSARIVHVLTPDEARAVGRPCGMGVQFREGEGIELVRHMIDEILGEVPPPEPDLPRPIRVLCADDNGRLLDRLATVLGEQGFLVETAMDGAAALAVCANGMPDVMIAAESLTLCDGWTLARELRGPIARGQLAFLIMSDEPSDATKMGLFGLDVAENWLQKPFTDAELVGRMRELAYELAARPLPPGLRVNLADMHPGTLLGFLERERKSGLAVVTRGAEEVKLHISQGRVLRVDSLPPTEARQKLREILEWPEGELVFRAGEVDGPDAVGCTISQILLNPE